MVQLPRLFCACLLSLLSEMATAGVLTLSQNTLDAPFPLTSEGDGVSVAPDNEVLLELEQFEIQEGFERGVALGLGVIAPWQKIAVHGLARAGTHRFWTANLGGGNFDMNGVHDARTYLLTIDTYSLVLGHRWMMARLLPFFVEPMFGYGAWHGRVEPKGSDPATDTVAATLDSSFSASGLMVGAQVGLFWVWENGVFLEYSIFRVGRGLPFNHAYSTRSDASRAAVRENLEHWYAWGFANLTLGWSF